VDIQETIDAPTARRRLVAAVSVTLAAWIPAAAAIVLSAAYGLPVVASGEFVSLYLLNAVVWGGVSGLLVARRPNPVGVILAVTAIGSALSALGTQLGRSPHPGWFDTGLAAHVIDRLWMPGTLATLSVLPLLLTARPLGRPARVLAVTGLVVALVPLALAVVRQKPGMAINPLAVVPQELVVAAFVVALSVSVALAIVTDLVLVWRWRRGPIGDRRGTGWLVLGQTMLILFFGPTFLPWMPVTAESIFRFTPLAPVVAFVFMVAAVVVVALGARLWGIETTVNRVVVDVLLLAVVVLVYVSVAIPLAGAFPVPPMIAGVAGVVLFALVLEPLRRFLQRRVDALVYGDAADPTQLLARLGAARHDGDLLDALVAELRDALRLDGLEVHAVERGLPAGPPGRRALVLPLRGAGGVEVGWVRAIPAGRQRVDVRTRRVLEGIAGVLAVALQLDAVNRELGEARDRAVAVGAEERRMLRRELQGGLVPALGRSAALLEHVAERLPAARAELAGIRSDLTGRTAEVRDLARTLVPGALDAGDLETALRELAARFSGDGLEIEVHSAGTDALEVVQQNAVHHVAAEAVLLLRRSPAVRRARLDVTVHAESAIVELGADAPFSLASAAAVILRSIADRADELGGRVDVDVARIRVEVPR